MDCGYTLERPRQGGSNEYPQSMFWSKNKKNGIPLQTPVLLHKSGVQGGKHYTDMFSCCICIDFIKVAQTFLFVCCDV